MHTVESAICWDGVYAKLCMYVVSADQVTLDAGRLTSGEVVPKKITGPYVLDDEAAVLSGRVLTFYEFALDRLPQDIKGNLDHWSSAAIDQGAEFVWFAFDGIFDFSYILDQVFANQIYYMRFADDEGSAALDDEVIGGEVWAQRVASARRRLFGLAHVAGSIPPLEAAMLLKEGARLICPVCGSHIEPLPHGWTREKFLHAITCSSDQTHFFVLFEDSVAMKEIRDLMATFVRK